MEYLFEHKDKVRDYECDLQGIVNNANYQHYLEHARHEFLLSKNVSFAELHEQGIDCVVSGIEMRFKVPLKSRDEYAVRINLKKEGLRYIFLQDIYRLSDDKLCLKAKVEAVCIVNGRLGDTDILMKALQ
ncbi:MAG: acyl-CoA thioesterase [Prevotella sp.]|nr:acyl-CoA thioesterase [Candidatus Prevotella equi]